MRENQNQTTYQEDEIDLWEILMAFKRRWWMILLAGLLGGCLAGMFSKFVLTPQYTSSAMLYVLSKETTLSSLADLELGTQLTKDYRIIVTSRPVLEDVIEKLELDMPYLDLRERLSIDNPTDTRILTISATDPDPRMAKQIVDQVALTASDYIAEIMEMVPPKMIEDGEIPMIKTSPHNAKNALLGAGAFGVLVCGILALGVILNDTIQSEEDVEKYLGLTVLASVPERGDGGRGSGKSVKKKKKKIRKRREKK